ARGIVLRHAEFLGVPAAELVSSENIGADVAAARAAGAQGILVPTPRTRQEEVDAAETVAATLDDAVSLVLAQRSAPVA
ncbi:HAD hydrolase-like protein, partial [Curtobacterium sp. B8]|uniref:HAD hydrolase-like protein n=1 Tax=Curtobacterium sp. B8 TaxID=95611 RepID=UPI0005B2C17E